jgi:hypothetical protein
VVSDAAEDGVTMEAPEEEQAERVGVEGLGYQVAHGGRVLARVGPVGAGAAWLQLARPRQQVDADVGGPVDDAWVELAVEEGGGMGGAGRDRREHGVPLRGAERAEPHPHAVGRRPRSLHLRGDLAGTDLEVVDMVMAGVGSPPR